MRVPVAARPLSTGVVSVPGFGHSNWYVVYLIFALICISLMTSDVERFFFFTCLFAIYRSLGRCLFRFSAHSLMQVVYVLIWNFKSSLCILNSSLLLDMPFANVYSHSLACLLIPLILIHF